MVRGALLISALLLYCCVSAADQTAQLINGVSQSELSRHLAKITAQDRVPGSEGVSTALVYCQSQFAKLGFRTTIEEFPVTIPSEEAATRITVGNDTLTLQAFWPNLVRTNRCDVSGELHYGGKGTLAELDGRDIEGGIVLLDIDSQANWTNAASLKAAALIFIASDQINRAECESKFKSIPLDVPRFLASAIVGARLKTLVGKRAHLTCRQSWIESTGQNLIADLAGSERSFDDQQILVFSFVDSMSTVPSNAPGAQTACSAAAVLELARLISVGEHRRPVRFVVSTGHSLSLLGAKSYVDRRFERPESPPLLVTTLDLSSGSRGLGEFGRGYLYNFRDEPLQRVQPIARTLRHHAENIVSLVGAPNARMVLADAVNGSDNRTWKNNIAAHFALDCEPFASAGYAAITFATIDDARPYVDTPEDSLSRVNLPNVRAQVQTLRVLYQHLLNDPLDKVDENALPLDPSSPGRLSLIGGFGTASGYLASFDPTKSLVPDTRIRGSIAVHLMGSKTLMGVRGHEIQMTTGREAGYRFIGLPPISSYGAREKPPTIIFGYHTNPQTGEIDYAPDDGVFGADTYPYVDSLKVSNRISPVVLFPCEATNVFGLTDPQDLTPLFHIDFADPQGGARPNTIGFARSFYDASSTTEVDDTGVIFTRPGQRIQMFGGSESDGFRLLLMNNPAASEVGTGYEPDGNSMGDVTIDAARDLCNVNQSRINRFAKYRMLPASVLETNLAAKEELTQSEKASDDRRWSDMKSHARSAWALALRIHPILKQAASDVVTGVIFYSFLLVPFSYFLERLFIATRSLTRQILASTLIFIASFFALRFIHPAFDLVSNPTMIFVGFVMGALSLLVISFILNKFERALREVKQVQSGLREVDVRRTDVAGAAINLGISNLRRRKARTFLTTLTLAVMSFIVLSFSSIVPEFQLLENPSSNPPTYNGILLRDPALEPLDNSTYLSMANEFRTAGTLARRVFSYGADIVEGSAMSLAKDGRSADVAALEGLDVGEAEVSRPQVALVAGTWFQKSDYNAVILSEETARSLKAAIGEMITFMGSELVVRGVYNSARMATVADLDGESILPPDFSLSKKAQSESRSQTRAFRPFIRLSPAVCFFLPAEKAISLGGQIRSVAVGFNSADQSRKALENLMPRLRLNLYGTVPNGTGREVRQFSLLQGSKSSGLGLVILQLIIASFFVVNTMIASVFERTREIAIFSAIGLSPNHIATLFFAESSVYGVLGSVFGYFAAQIVAKFLVATGSFPALTLNFSSTSAILSTGLVLAVVLGSAIYPARKAAQIAAPAMAAEALVSIPEGDKWTIELPFSVPESEASPIIAFLGEWLAGHEEYSIGDFVTQNTRVSAHQVEAMSWLAPFDLGVSQEMSIVARPSAIVGAWTVELQLSRVSGEPKNWHRVNTRFQSALRRQFLRWRTLSAEERDRYATVV